MNRPVTPGLFLCLFWAMAALGQTSLVNWEHPQVHPLEMTPDRTKLLVVNTADARLEVFGLAGGMPALIGSIPVGLDPVSVRAYDDDRAWVVNHVSDSVSIVDLTTMNVVATVATGDEPADVVFAGSPLRVFVSCSQVNSVQVFDPADLAATPLTVPIAGEDPRSLAVSADLTTVYAAIFESGNATTILGGGAADTTIGFPPNVVSDPLGPHGGQNPPPNSGALFDPPMNAANPAPPAVGLIVRKNAAGAWMDDNNGDWTALVTGPLADHSGRLAGWDLPDHDVAVIDASTLGVTYQSGLMNLCMAIAVQPVTGHVTVVGTDATNEIRFEPVLGGRFLRVNMATFDPGLGGSAALADLNPHLTYAVGTVPQADRDLSLGDPRAIVWNSAGTAGYVAGMGSNNVIVVNSDGERADLQPPIEVGEGPTGLALDENRNRLYVLNRFAGSISVIDTNLEVELGRVPLFDPTPTAIRVGRKHLYDTRKNSGLGHISCASCHVDGRMDRIAWDLGDPAGEMKTFNQNCNLGIGGIGPPCESWHPMKGPMTTQTLQDIIGKEPHHWRGDRNGLEEFNPAFMGLLGDDAMLSSLEMQEFEDFLATLVFPPNPYRNFDNTLPTDLPLPGHFTPGRFGPAGQPLPNGNAVNGLLNYRTGDLDQGLECVSCHTLPSGLGSNLRLTGFTFTPFPVGPNGERHHAVVSVDGSTNVSIKVPQLRNLFDKVGFETTQTSNLAGFGFLHDGSVDSLARFVSEPVFEVASDQEIADLVAFMLSFSGSNLPMGSTTNPFELVGPTSRDTHAAVGKQVTCDATNHSDPVVVALLNQMIALADSGRVGLTAKGVQAGLSRGYVYTGGQMFQSDRQMETITATALRMSAGAGEEITFTVVPAAARVRIGVDRDADSFFDRDELAACSDPSDATSIPGSPRTLGDANGDGDVNLEDFPAFLACLAGPQAGADDFCRCTFDMSSDADVDLADYQAFELAFTER